MQTIIELERTAAAHWRGTEEQRLGDWLLRAAEGFTGRANSALPFGDPGLPLDEALAAVTDWYRARGLPPMIVVPTALEADPTGQALDNHLAERNWATRPGPAFVMVADLPLRAWASATRTATTTAWPRRSAVRALRFALYALCFARHAGNIRCGDTPEARDTSAGAGYSLRLGLWLPLGPGARQARGAGGRAPSAVTTTTMSRPT